MDSWHSAQQRLEKHLLKSQFRGNGLDVHRTTEISKEQGKGKGNREMYCTILFMETRL